MITVQPAAEVAWDTLRTVFGDRGDAHRCQCQYFRTTGRGWAAGPVRERAQRLREHPAGLVAFVDGEAAGWCAIEPRTRYVRLLAARVPWAGRSEDKHDEHVWALPCFVTRAGFRRRGVSRALARAAVDHAREQGAHALEGYPLVVEPGQPVAWGSELYVGTAHVFAEAGFTEVSRPTPRRAVMRVDFPPADR